MTSLDAIRRSKFWSRKYLLGLLLAVVIIAIVVPIAVVFGRKKGSSTRSDVLVPLYVYPAPGAWDPLFTAVEEHPGLHFTVVVNPASGPGQSGPDLNYTREIPRLNAYANVRTVGYVSTNYTSRAIDLALEDVRTWATWSDNPDQNISMHGIFLDEAVSLYEETSLQYYGQIASSIWSSSGLGRDPLIIHNPGVIPDERYLAFCNLTIAFEGSYSTYQIRDHSRAVSEFSKSSKYGRDYFASIVHGVPSGISRKDEKAFVKDVRSSSGSVFITGLTIDYYSSFWSGWLGFVDDLA